MSLPKIKLVASTRRLVRYGQSFVVGFALSMGLLLGTDSIPGYISPLELFPGSHRKTLIIVSSLLLGLLATALDFLSREDVSRTSIRRWFFSILPLTFLATLFLLGMQLFYVVEATCFEEPMVIGWSRIPPPGCGCGNVSSEICLGTLECKPDACWSEAGRKQVTLTLYLLYLLILSGFEVLIALVVLQERAVSKARQGGRGQKAAQPPAKPDPGSPMVAVSTLQPEGRVAEP